MLIVYFFVLVPINNAVDDAPNRILSINQTILIIIGILITFKIFNSQKSKNFLDYLAKAKTSQLNPKKSKNETESQDIVTKWKTKSSEEKREDVAGIILNYYTKAEDSSED